MLVSEAGATLQIWLFRHCDIGTRPYQILLCVCVFVQLAMFVSLDNPYFLVFLQTFLVAPCGQVIESMFLPLQHWFLFLLL